VHEQPGGTEVYDGHGIDLDTVAEKRKQNQDLCAVTGEWHDIDDLTVVPMPVYDNRQDDFVTRDTIPARVLDRPHIRRWAEQATELKSANKPLTESEGNRQRELRADRPGHPERDLRNLTPEKGVYIGVPKRHRPDPTAKTLYYNGEKSRDRVPPRPELLDDSFPEMHDWGESTSNNSGAITAASLITYEYGDPELAANLAYPLERHYIGTDRFQLSDGIWVMSSDELREMVEAVKAE